MTRLLIAASLLIGGCHGRFKKAAPHIDHVRVKTMIQGGPSARMGGVEGDGVLAAVVDGVQAYRGIKIADRMTAIDPRRSMSAFESGLAANIDGAPFTTQGKKKAPLFQIEVLDYGLDASALGQQGTFFTNMRMRIYERDGRRVYASSYECHTGFADADVWSQLTGTVDNLKQLNDLSDEQLQELFDWGLDACSAQVVARLRKHAG